MAESKICGVVVHGDPVQVKVIIDFQKVAQRLAAKARRNPKGRTSVAAGAVRVEVVPVKKVALASGILVDQKGKTAMVSAIDAEGRAFLRSMFDVCADEQGRYAVQARSVYDLKHAAVKRGIHCEVKGSLEL
jgi:hypothetical protein